MARIRNAEFVQAVERAKQGGYKREFESADEATDFGRNWRKSAQRNGIRIVIRGSQVFLFPVEGPYPELPRACAPREPWYNSIAEEVQREGYKAIDCRDHDEAIEVTDLLANKSYGQCRGLYAHRWGKRVIVVNRSNRLKVAQ